MRLPPNANILWARILLGALRRGGARHVCVSPGSRCAPLVLAAREIQGFELTVHLDERSAAFFALGHALATRTPSVLICTSGTAAANYLPAVCEASQACVPMILLTADRPAELRFAGAPQTMDQRNLYGGFARGFHELALPDASREALIALRDTAWRAVGEATGPPAGPVQIDVPFREPLSPAEEDAERVGRLWEWWMGGPGADVPPPCAPRPVDVGETEDALDHLRAARRPWVLAGPGSTSAAEAAAVHRFASAWKAPILADVGSGLRFRVGGGAEAERGEVAHDCAVTCGHVDAIARALRSVGDMPDVVLRFGGLPTSKATNELLARIDCTVFAVQTDDRRRDPDGVVRAVIRGKTDGVCDRFAAALHGGDRVEPGWSGRFARADRIACAFLRGYPLPLEAAVVRAAIEAMPARSTVFLSNSMPIRWADFYSDASDAGHDVFANRGVNGIDGITSSAFGAALGTGRPLLLVTGDLAFLHDLGGLGSARWLGHPAVVLLLNNDGGGIFAHLPIARFPEVDRSLIETPHAFRLAPAAEIFGLDHATAATAAEVTDQVALAVDAGRMTVIEVRTERNQMAVEHAALVRALVGEIQRAWS